MRPNKLSHWSLEQRKVYCRAMQGELEYFVPPPPPAKTPNTSKDFSKALLKARWVRGVVSCCKLLGVGILCSCNCPCRLDHSVPVNFQQDKCYSPFFRFLSLYEWVLRGQSPGNRLSCTFQDADHVLLQKVQSTHDSAQAIGLLITTWSQICSSLLCCPPPWGCKLVRAQDFG